MTDGELLISALHESAEVRRAETLAAVARDLARSVPPPRGAPFFYLDAAPAYSLDVLDSLSRRGIFRKYEFVLEIGCRLGARARWLAAHLGCRVVGVDPRPETIAAAQLLNRRAHIEEQVLFQVGLPGQLPLRQRRFTHVWILDPERCPPASDTVAEAFRVLRPGGYLAIHGLQTTEASRTTLPALLRASGFIDLEVCQVPLHEVPHACRVARERLSVAVHGHARPHSMASAPEAGACVQIFGRRPA